MHPAPNMPKFVAEEVCEDSDPSEEEEDLEVIASQTHEYSDAILFFTRTGLFQSNSLADTGRKKGLITLLGMRVVNIDTKRRLAPVKFSMIPGSKPQRVFIFATVRKSKF